MHGLDLVIDSDYKPSAMKALLILPRTNIDEVDIVS